MLFDRMIVSPGPLSFTVTLPETMLLAKVTVMLPIRFTLPAKRFPAQPNDAFPIRTGTVASNTPKAWLVEDPDIWDPQMLRKPGLLAAMPRLIWELTTVSAPPGLTVTGPATRALSSCTLSPALTVSGPRWSPVMVRVNVGGANGEMTTDS
jgi:hypothetical protein